MDGNSEIIRKKMEDTENCFPSHIFCRHCNRLVGKQPYSSPGKRQVVGKFVMFHFCAVCTMGPFCDDCGAIGQISNSFFCKSCIDQF